jgi:hypothetical protein
MNTRLMFVLLAATVIALMPCKGVSQDNGGKDQGSVMQDLKVQFGGKFAVKIKEDDNKLYFLADFTQLPTRFEKIWFLNQVFKSKILVNTDADLTHEAVSFSSSSKFTEEEALNEFALLKNKTQDVNSKMTPEEKENWLKTNDKYK